MFKGLSSVCRLKPFTSYKLRMLATNDIGDSIVSIETESVTTLQDGENTMQPDAETTLNPETRVGSDCPLSSVFVPPST